MFITPSKVPNSLLFSAGSIQRKNSGEEADWEKIDEDKPEPSEVIEAPPGGDYVAWKASQDKAELEAIGKRFQLPGRAINHVENQAKSLSRRLVGTGKELASSMGSAICNKAVSMLKKSAKAIEDWQGS